MSRFPNPDRPDSSKCCFYYYSTEPLRLGHVGILRDYFVPSKYISFHRNIFRSFQIYFVPSKINKFEIHFVLSKSASFPPNTLPPVEIPIVSPSKLASKLAGTVLRNAEELKKKLSTFSLGGGGGGGARRPSQSVAITRTIFRIWHVIYRV